MINLDSPESNDSANVLAAHGYGVAFGNKVVLAELDFELPSKGITVLMGPVGTGKSTLMRSLAGLNNSSSNFRQWGRVEYQGQLISASNCPPLVVQQARLLSKPVYQHLIDGIRSSTQLNAVELRSHVIQTLNDLGLTELESMLEQPSIDIPVVWQRIVNILGMALPRPALLMVDEPCSGLSGFDEFVMLSALTSIANLTSLLVVLHNQKQARSIASQVMLLAGGRIQAQDSPEGFFERPRGEVAQTFIATGSCNVPSPDAVAENLAEDVKPPPPLPLAAQLAIQATPEYRGPTGFRWVIPGRVAGTPMPGVVQSIDMDMAALRTVGVTMLITLTESDISQEALHRNGLRNLHLPIRDREPPTVAQIRMLVVRMNALLAKGEVLAVHCLAGLGRTGTVLASWLIQDGLTAQAALERLRRIEPGYVQSESQEQFLHQVEADLLKRI